MRTSGEYHVGCSNITGCIYAGKMKELKDGWKEWITKSEVTDEAVRAVAEHLLHNIEGGKEYCAYMFSTTDGRWLRLKLEVLSHKPDSKEGADDEKRPD